MAENIDAPKGRKRTIDLLPDDVVRLSKLAAFYRARSVVEPNETQVIRLAFKDACVALGLEQRTDVEPIGDGS